MLKAVSSHPEQIPEPQVPLITFGTPFGGWMRLARWLRDHADEGIQLGVPEFSDWLERIIGREADLLSSIARGIEIPEPVANSFLKEQAQGLAAAQNGHRRWGGMDARACWTANLWAELYPEAKFLVFYEGPEVALANAMAADEPVDPRLLLHAWRTGAERTLRLVHRHRERVVLIDAREAVAAPERLMAQCAETLGIPFEEPAALDTQAAPDAVCLGLAAAWTHGDRALRRVCTELEVSCTPLMEDDALEAVQAAYRGDPVDALWTYHATRRELSSVAAEAQQLTERLAAAQQRTAAANAAFAGECARLQRLHEHSLAEAEAEAGAAQAALRDADEALRSAAVQQRAAKRRHADIDTRLTATAAALQQARSSLREERASAETRVHALRAECDALRRQIAEMREAGEEGECERAELWEAWAETDEALSQAKREQAQLETWLTAARTAGAERVRELEAQGRELRGQAELVTKEKDELRQANELLLIQLNQVREELQATFLDRQTKERERDELVAELTQVRAALHQEKANGVSAKKALEDARSQTQRKLTEVTAALEQARADRATLEAALAAEKNNGAKRMSELDASAKAARAQADADGKLKDDVQQENELLLLQLHQVQEELEHYFLENQKLKSAGAHDAHASTVKADKVHAHGTFDEVPYRHVNVTLQSVTHRDRQLNAVRARLVEHDGTPGLVLFAPENPSLQLLSCWEESGQEDGKRFMLIHPTHKTGQALLAGMNATDWTFITDIAVLIDAALREQAASMPGTFARWQLVCRRLRDQFAEGTDRLRYDAATLDHDAEANGVRFNIKLKGAAYANWFYPVLELAWCMPRRRNGRAAAPMLTLGGISQPESGTLPPIAAWPVNDDGTACEQLELRFGSADGGEAPWAAYSQRDREFLAALIRVAEEVIRANPVEGVHRTLNPAQMSRWAAKTAEQVLRPQRRSAAPWTAAMNRLKRRRRAHSSAATA
jgi:hypothetical protein